MSKKWIKEKEKLIKHIRSIPFAQLEKELEEAGLEKSTKNSESDKANKSKS